MQNAENVREGRPPLWRQPAAHIVVGCLVVGAVAVGIGASATTNTEAETRGVGAVEVAPTSSPSPSASASASPSASSDEASSATSGSPTAPVGSLPVEASDETQGTEEKVAAQEDAERTPVVPSPVAPLEPKLEDAVDRFVDAFQVVIQPDVVADLSKLEEVADGSALMELKAQAAEATANEWRFEGDAEVVNAETMESSADEAPDAMRVLACIDSSGVALLDQDGATIQANAPAGSRRSLNIYDLERRDQAWVVVDHSFPDNADC